MNQSHGVRDGTVFCARQGRPVDVVTCYGCERLVDIDLDSRHPKVVCAAPGPGEPVLAAG